MGPAAARSSWEQSCSRWLVALRRPCSLPTGWKTRVGTSASSARQQPWSRRNREQPRKQRQPRKWATTACRPAAQTSSYQQRAHRSMAVCSQAQKACRKSSCRPHQVLGPIWDHPAQQSQASGSAAPLAQRSNTASALPWDACRPQTARRLPQQGSVTCGYCSRQGRFSKVVLPALSAGVASSSAHSCNATCPSWSLTKLGICLFKLPHVTQSGIAWKTHHVYAG